MLDGKVFKLNGSLLGFEDCNEFRISLVEGNKQFAHFQSVEQEYVAFLVVSPFAFYPDYWLDLDECDKHLLKISSGEEVSVLSIVTIADSFADSTINLLAPIVLNTRSGLGKQIVLPPKSNYSTKEALLKFVPLESGE
ncbi:flagellar assembly protein FliW [Paenibacillus silvisoli]|uniref:flagellar assembly protein FliW n=1 Tax=Paenibacillus silvisoli TaxID=3110539 RepID=UPI0028063FFC|nr:flagellar assembly protein FliW [Paenibacillus silvisoli]